jgi:myo-inositol-1-phosphate synthase
MSPRYQIKETWRVWGQIERYDSEHKTLAAVKKYIQDWIESWQDQAKESGYKVVMAKTDYKTFAKLKIESSKMLDIQTYDTFSLKVNDRSVTKPKIVDLVS